jgi:alanine racemase
MTTRPVWVEVSREHLLGNYERLRRTVSPQAELLPIVKANAYGHGLALCGPALAAARAPWLGVTCAEEGVALRTALAASGGRAPRILLMSGIWAGEADTVLEHHLTPVVWEPGHLEMLEQAAEQRKMLPGSLPVHLEIDTGMSRQGVRVTGGAADGELASLLARLGGDSRVHLEGVMTHFSSPEILSSSTGNPQLVNFQSAVDQIRAHGLRPEWLHAGNSSTVVAGPDREKLIALAAESGARLLLRPGLALYGYLDRMSCDGKPYSPANSDSYQPVLTWKARITSLRTLRTGETAGYDHTFTARRPTRLALLPAGYADGINRLLSNRGHVLIRGERAPIAGRVSMDQTIVDVTDVPGAALGDEAVLLGSQGGHTISAWEIADLIGTVPWEVLCAIGARVPRLAVP